LQGRQFKIEYASPAEQESYPIPSHLDTKDNKYPEAVIVDQLPKNIVSHVQSSKNPALVAVLNPGMSSVEQQPQLKDENKSRSLTLNQSNMPALFHHAAQVKQRVKQSRPKSIKNTEKKNQQQQILSETLTAQYHTIQSHQVFIIDSLSFIN
jgi:hypothetical protein